MNAETNLLQEFNEDVKASLTIPYLQIQNPPNLTLAQIQQYQSPYGWFIPHEQAELVDFAPNDRFTPTRLTFGEDTSQPRQVDGWLTQRVRVSILHKNAGIEVQEKTDRGWPYVGQAYYKSQLSKYGQLADVDLADVEKENYRFRTRYLLVFLDENENNEPLHRIPLQLSMGKGTGGTFGEEVKQFRTEIERVFFKLRGEPQKTWGDLAQIRFAVRAHALTVLDLELGIHKGEGKAPFITPVKLLTPSVDGIGVETVVDRRERQVKLLGESSQSLLIPKSSQTGGQKALTLLDSLQLNRLSIEPKNYRMGGCPNLSNFFLGQFLLGLWNEYREFPTRFGEEQMEKEEMQSVAQTAQSPFETNWGEDDF